MGKFQVKKLCIPISFEEVYSRLRLEDNLQEDLKTVVQDINKCLGIVGGFSIFDQIEIGDEGITVGSGTLLCHKKVCRLLYGSTRIAVFVCTLGKDVSTLYNEYTSQSDFVKAYLSDQVANIIMGKAVEEIKKEIFFLAKHDCLGTTSHLSPGYCDWSIDEQKKLFALLPPEPCGISLTSSCLMQPMKSVSGVIGIGEQVVYKETNCELCHLQKCLYRSLPH